MRLNWRINAGFKMSQRSLEAMPDDGQAPDQDGNQNTHSSQGTLSSAPSKTVEALRAESAKYRTRAREAQARLDEMSAKLAALESAESERESRRLQEEGDFKTLLEQANQRVATLTAARNADLIERAAVAEMLRAGVVNPDQQAFLMSGILARAGASVVDGKVKGGLKAAVSEAVSIFGLGAPSSESTPEPAQTPAPEPAPPRTMHPAIALLQHQTPSATREMPKTKSDATTALADKIRAARLNG